MAEVIYAVAMSLDGYIADADGGVDWLHAAMVKDEGYGLMEFMSSIDAILMGSRTYEQALQMGGGGLGSSTPSWIFSKRAFPAKKGVQVTASSPREIVEALPARGVRRAWLMGGGTLASSFLADGLIDEVSVAVMPVVLGSGLPLFQALPRWISLELTGSTAYKGGALGLRYRPAGAPAR